MGWTVVFEDEGGRVEVEDNSVPHVVRVVRANGQVHETWRTAYPTALIERIARLKGTAFVIDEIRRDEDSSYVSACLEVDLFGYVRPQSFAGKRLLDFGCGAGASSMILGRSLPDTQIVGIDLDDAALEVARARADFYGFDHVRFMVSPRGDALPDGLGRFDYIVLSAVYEHLLPDERGPLLRRLWDLLEPDGALFLNQTPWRWFPFDGHTTRLPLIAYLPDRVALWAARRFSKRVGPQETWPQLLRRGIRGGTVRQIMAILRSAGGDPELLRPCRPDLHDRVDVWRAGYAVAIARRHPWVRAIQHVLYGLFKIVRWTTGLTIVPALSLAIRKKPTKPGV